MNAKKILRATTLELLKDRMPDELTVTELAHQHAVLHAPVGDLLRVLIGLVVVRLAAACVSVAVTVLDDHAAREQATQCEGQRCADAVSGCCHGGRDDRVPECRACLSLGELEQPGVGGGHVAAC